MPVNKSKAAFRTIAELAEELGVATHVLRFWETKFEQIKPMKRSGGRRYYRPDDVEIINDDMPVIKYIDDSWYLCGSPWSGKTEININKKNENLHSFSFVISANNQKTKKQ